MGEVNADRVHGPTRRELLTLNLDSGMAILSFEYPNKTVSSHNINDLQAPIGDEGINLLRKKFAADASVITINFNVYGSVKVIGKIIVKHASGISNEAEFTESCIEDVAAMRDKLFKESNKVLGPGESEKFIDLKRNSSAVNVEDIITNFGAEITMPEARDAREILIKDVYRMLYDELSLFDENWIMLDERQLNEEIADVVKKIVRNNLFTG